MKTFVVIAALMVASGATAMAQNVKKQVEAAKQQSTVTHQADKADAWQQKQIQQQQLKDSTQKPAIKPKKSSKHCGKPKASKKDAQ